MTGAEKTRAGLRQARRLLIKIGSRALVNKKGELDQVVFRSVTDDVAGLKDAGTMTAIVSSGAILAGRSRLGLAGRELNMRQKQAAAAVGQNGLMSEWGEALARHGIETGQILLTAEDLAERTRFLNSSNTMEELLGLGVVPIINENDTVAVEEIRYGDNDHIATLVAGLMQAEALIILTDIDGLCREDPKKTPEAPVVHLVMEQDTSLFACAGPSSGGIGSGGMATKIEAARTVAKRGVPTVIANAKRKGVIRRIMAGQEVGTLFVPEGKPMKGRKYWLAFAGEARGKVEIDEGAKGALKDKGKSLLPSGVTRVFGTFQEGDMVAVVDAASREVAKGLTFYSSGELEKIKGKKTSEIEAILGQKLYDEVIHRDYLVLTGKD